MKSFSDHRCVFHVNSLVTLAVASFQLATVDHYQPQDSSVQRRDPKSQRLTIYFRGVLLVFFQNVSKK